MFYFIFFFRKGYAKGRTFPYIILLTVATLFNIIPVIQYYENFKAVWHYLKSKGKIVEQRYHLNKYIHGNNNVVSQRIWECYFEAIPQIMIQLHIVFNRTDINWKNNSISENKFIILSKYLCIYIYVTFSFLLYV